MIWSDAFSTPPDNKGPFYFGPLAGYEKDLLPGKGGEVPGRRREDGPVDQDPRTPEEIKQTWKRELEGDLYGPEDVPTWDEFTQNTTFHGIRYVFDRTNYTCRRYAWMGVVVLAVLLFMAQVSQRMVVYFQYKTNVAVEVKYVDKITFPSVTICNQNNFRITATVGWRLYDFIDQVYSVRSEHLPDLNLTKYNLDVNTTDFVVTTAHRKADLIESCTWHGNPCDIENDFVVTLTDLGVCFTFNMKEPALDVSEPGSGTALSLILNVEQYEYMRGPQNDAGIKVQLHHQGEIPSMKDQGFAVAPGTHTLVGVKRVVVSSLPAPFGTCFDGYGTPVIECKKNCKTAKLVKLCGCRDIYMNYLEEAPSEICNMTNTFICSQLVVESLRKNASDCLCPVPCHMIKYEPSLSYAQLSRQNTDRYLVPGEERKRVIEEKFQKALETSQRVVKETYEADNTQMNEVLSAASELFYLVEANNSIDRTLELLVETHNVVDLITTNIVEDDVQFIKDRGDEIIKNSIYLYLDWYKEWLGSHAEYYAGQMLQIVNHNESKVLTYFEACEASNKTMVLLGGNEPSGGNNAITTESESTSVDVTTAAASFTTPPSIFNITELEYESYCNESELFGFNDTWWQKFSDLVNSNVSGKDYIIQAKRIRRNFPTFLKLYLADEGLSNLKAEKHHLRQFLNSTFNITEIFHTVCSSAIATTASPVVTVATENVPTIPEVHATLPSDVINCSHIFHEVKTTYFSFNLDALENGILELDNFKENYLTDIRKVYVNMNDVLDSIPQQIKCMDTLNYLETLTVELKHMFELLKNTSKAENIEEAIPVLKQLFDDYIVWSRLNVNFTLYGRLVINFDYCAWVRKVAYAEDDEFPKIIEKLESTTDYKKKSYSYLEYAFFSYEIIEVTYLMKVLPTIEDIRLYLSGNMTKKDLAANFNKPVFTKALNDLADAATEMESSIKDLKTEVGTLNAKVVEEFKELAKFTLPFLNKVNVYELSLIKAVKVVNKSSYDTILENFEVDFEKGIADLLTALYSDWVTHVVDMVTRIADTVDDLTGKVVALQGDLSDYKTTTKMDVDFYMENFIQIDVFYQEISFEEIQQNKAFEFLSLLSEVGGFLGLLLGASVLTVCELVDYITLLFLHKCRSQKQVTPRDKTRIKLTLGPCN